MEETTKKLIHREFEEAAKNSKSSRETRERFDRVEKTVADLGGKMDSFLDRFDRHLVTKETQMASVGAKIDSISANLSEHMRDESGALNEMHELIKATSPFQKEAAENAIFWKKLKGYLGVIFWLSAGISGLIALYALIMSKI